MDGALPYRREVIGILSRACEGGKEVWVRDLGLLARYGGLWVLLAGFPWAEVLFPGQVQVTQMTRNEMRHGRLP